jgi:hypothetical protein
VPVVDHQWQPGRVLAVAGDADVVGIGDTGDGIQEQHVAWSQRLARGHALPVAPEVADQILHAAVVDAGVAPAPDARVGRRRRPGIPEDRLLQIDAGVAKRPDDHVGADALGARHVATGKRQRRRRLSIERAVQRDLLRPEQDVDRIGNAVAVPVRKAALSARQQLARPHHPAERGDRDLPVQIRIDAPVASIRVRRPGEEPGREPDQPACRFHIRASPQPPYRDPRAEIPPPRGGLPPPGRCSLFRSVKVLYIEPGLSMVMMMMYPSAARSSGLASGAAPIFQPTCVARRSSAGPICRAPSPLNCGHDAPEARTQRTSGHISARQATKTLLWPA